MTRIPKSTHPRSRLPIGFAAVCAALAALASPLAGQGSDRITAATEFVKDPGGTVLGRLVQGAIVRFGAERDAFREVTFDGWVASASLRDDAREGYDVSIAPGAIGEVRSEPRADAALRATAVIGALFHRVGTRGGWVQVRRTAWVPAGATRAATASPPPAVPTAAAPQATSDSAGPALPAGSEFSARPDGPPIGRVEATRPVRVVDRQGGWSRVQLDVWVRDAVVGSTAAPDQISAAEIRADPDRFVGQTVEWSLQVLAVQLADELRPELPLGQPYVLARGPLPETGFVYLVVQGSEVEAFRRMEPLAQVRVRATVRAGKTRFLPTPVLDLVRRID